MEKRELCLSKDLARSLGIPFPCQISFSPTVWHFSWMRTIVYKGVFTSSESEHKSENSLRYLKFFLWSLSLVDLFTFLFAFARCEWTLRERNVTYISKARDSHLNAKNKRYTLLPTAREGNGFRTICHVPGRGYYITSCLNPSPPARLPPPPPPPPEGTWDQTGTDMIPPWKKQGTRHELTSDPIPLWCWHLVVATSVVSTHPIGFHSCCKTDLTLNRPITSILQ